MSPPAAASFAPAVAWSAAGRSERLATTTLLALIALVSWYLLPFWRESPELSHGYFAPLCALALLWQSRREPNCAAPWNRIVSSGVHLALLAGGMSVAWIAALAALAQGPFHTQTGFLTGILVTILTLSGVLALAQSPTAIVRLNGASLGAALLWCFAVPLPSGTLARFTLFLQNWITAGSLHTLHLFGFAAERNGNIIKLADTLVGVEEACSGIRSLTACLFAGVVLGGLMLSGFGRRILLVVAAGAIAVASNFVRSVTLCLMAANGIEIRGFWHDATAYAVLGVTALVLFGGCLLLSPKVATPEGVAPPSPSRRGRTVTAMTLHAALAGFAVLLLALVAVKVAPAPASERPPPDLEALTVFASPDWIRRTDESIFAFSKALNTSHLRQESYYRGKTQLTFYVAFWPTNQSTLGSVALHTPDICLPGSGWETIPTPRRLVDYPLADPRRFSFRKNDYPQHVWFWHYFDGAPVAEKTGLYPWQLGPLLLEPAVRANAPQWVVRVSSNQPLETLLDEPILREFFARLRAAGLAGRPTT